MPTDIPEEIESFLKTAWLDDSESHLTTIRLVGKPVLFFVLYASSSGQQTLDAEIEKSRSNIIQKLAEEAGVTTVFFEGGNGEHSGFRCDKSTADSLIDSGNMKAEEHAQACSSANITLMGIDNMTRYQESATALSKWRTERKEFMDAIAVVAAALRSLREQCSGELRAILESRDDHEEGRLGFMEYAQFLAAEAEGAAVCLDGMVAFKTLLRVLSEETKINFAAAEHEQEVLQRELGPALSDPHQWIGKSLAPFEPQDLPKARTVEEIETQAKQVDAYVRSSPERMRAFRESTFFRITMYGAYCKGLDALERRDTSPEEQNKAAVVGMFDGPKAIGDLVEAKQSAYVAGHLSAEDMYDFVLDLAALASFDESRIPNLIRYAQYANRNQAVWTFELFEQIRHIEDQLIEKAAFTKRDREVATLYALFRELKARVRLNVAPGKAAEVFVKESDSDNRAQVIRSSPGLIGSNRTLLKSLHVLDRIESVARDFYAGSVPRGRDMAENLQKHLNREHLDRCVVLVGGFHCASMIEMIRQDPHTSYLVISPVKGRGQTADVSTSRVFGGITGGYEPDLLFYRGLGEPGIDDFDKIPRKQCVNVVCRFSAPGIVDRVVCLKPPGSLATFYCATCKRFYCGLELQQVPASEEQLQALPEDNSLRILLQKTGDRPFSLACRHCGDFVGKGDRTVIWDL